MNKAQIVEAISDQMFITKTQSEEFVDVFVKIVFERLRSGDDVKLVGFGTFITKKRKGRMGRNPRTGATIKIPAMRVPKFVPGSALKETLKNGKQI